MPPQKTLKVGDKVTTLAKYYGEEYAKAEFGGEWKTATVDGAVIGRDDGKWICDFGEQPPLKPIGWERQHLTFK